MTIGTMISKISFTDEEKKAIKDAYKLLHTIHGKMPTDASINSDHDGYGNFYDWEDLNTCMNFLNDLFSGVITIEYDPED